MLPPAWGPAGWDAATTSAHLELWWLLGTLVSGCVSCATWASIVPLKGELRTLHCALWLGIPILQDTRAYSALQSTQSAHWLGFLPHRQVVTYGYQDHFRTGWDLLLLGSPAFLPHLGHWYPKAYGLELCCFVLPWVDEEAASCGTQFPS
jgi:hypothetical protein